MTVISGHCKHNHFEFKGRLDGHADWVTSIAVAGNTVVTGSRDKTLIRWDVAPEEELYGRPKRQLRGHSHFVQDVVLSEDGQYALSGSWDATLRLWDLNTGVCSKRFVGHSKDVLTVALSPDNRQIISGARDGAIKLWNTLGECKATIQSNTTDGHSDWVSCVRFSPDLKMPLIVSGSWDRSVKVWNLNNWTLQTNLVGHSGYVSTVCISPDGSLCASGGKDSTVQLWDLLEGKHLTTLDAGEPINALTFSPNRYWLCAATANKVKIWDLESKTIQDELEGDFGPLSNKAQRPQPTCLAWSADGATLFVGFSNGRILVWTLPMQSASA